ncbi:hypothetical protein [Sphingomonas sanxanigenens]|uniref:Uncharacterized protein n=1 Tax=Sphingomonas sanxanigenens DSM 19645 = NX02 TaxID=1123269 RepID=W0A820_9SPHN|nr:hypothetical protein [Sphingomonas sanxanigenens]AHE52622.1 hypothetical protein NX02_04370 [Sphingomonas sanxanigenens DSM 19645 = NX02]
MDNVRPLKAVVARVAAGMPSSEPLTQTSLALPTSLQDLDLDTLPARLDDTTLAMVRRIADEPPPALTRCDERHFKQCMRVMRTTLPSRAAEDDLSGSLFATAYYKSLGHRSNEAISFLLEHALAECRWFPTIVECNAILARWSRGDDAFARHGQATAIVRREVEARFAEAFDALEEGRLCQAEIDALPDQWKRIAAERCLLWHHDDGSFTDRTGLAARDEKQANANGSLG